VNSRGASGPDPDRPLSVATRTVGLLALQGDFHLHRLAALRLGHRTHEVRTRRDLEHVDCLIMPGGESTTMRKLMRMGGLDDALRSFAQTHPVMGTCAGLILLSKGIDGEPQSETLGLLDCTVSRNAYGRQVFSFRGEGRIRLAGHENSFEMVFIRAPRIQHVGSAAQVLGYLGEEPVMIRQGHILGLTFHPELADDDRVHEFFLSSELLSS